MPVLPNCEEDVGERNQGQMQREDQVEDDESENNFEEPHPKHLSLTADYRCYQNVANVVTQTRHKHARSRHAASPLPPSPLQAETSPQQSTCRYDRGCSSNQLLNPPKSNNRHRRKRIESTDLRDELGHSFEALQARIEAMTDVQWNKVLAILNEVDISAPRPTRNNIPPPVVPVEAIAAEAVPVAPQPALAHAHSRIRMAPTPAKPQRNH